MHLELIKIVTFKFFHHLKIHLSSILFSLLLTLGDTSRTEGVVDVNVDVEETFMVRSNPIVWEFPVINLTVAHEMILKVIINHDGVHINHIWVLVNSQNKLLRVNETNIHIDGTDECLKNILQNLGIVIPPVSHTLL